MLILFLVVVFWSVASGFVLLVIEGLLAVLDAAVRLARWLARGDAGR